MFWIRQRQLDNQYIRSQSTKRSTLVWMLLINWTNILSGFIISSCIILPERIYSDHTEVFAMQSWTCITIHIWQIITSEATTAPHTWMRQSITPLWVRTIIRQHICLLVLVLTWVDMTWKKGNKFVQCIHIASELQNSRYRFFYIISIFNIPIIHS